MYYSSRMLSHANETPARCNAMSRTAIHRFFFAVSDTINRPFCIYALHNLVVNVKVQGQYCPFMPFLTTVIKDTYGFDITYKLCE